VTQGRGAGVASHTAWARMRPFRTADGASQGAPPRVGKHTVRFSGAIVFTQAPDGFDFSFALDVTYHLTVAPRRGDRAGAT